MASFASDDFPAILAAARGGAEWAWAHIYRAYSPPVLRYVRAHGAHEPEDVLGEVFVQVVRNVGAFEGGESEFRSWVFMIAHNRLVDSWRRQGRSKVDLVSAEKLVEIAGSGDSEYEVTRRIDEAQMVETLRRLTPDQRNVLFLRFFGRLTVDEVAVALGKRSSAVKALQVRGIAAIRREISG